MGYETKTCAGCGHREPMDLSTEIRFAGEFGPLCDDCRPLALRTMEANTKDNADPALAARADAAERLAVARVRLEDAGIEYDNAPGGPAEAKARDAYYAAEAEADAAMVAWQTISKGVNRG